MRQAALLGSINVGGNRLTMQDLRDALSQAGFAGVETVGASGNVLFDHPGGAGAKPEARFARVLQDTFGIYAFAAVRTRNELAAAIADNPFVASGEDAKVHTLFLEEQPSAQAFDRLVADSEGRGGERMAIGTGALYVDYTDGVARSKLTNDFIARRLGCRVTARNISSLRRILAKMET